jgi:hypothetical protein
LAAFNLFSFGKREDNSQDTSIEGRKH